VPRSPQPRFSAIEWAYEFWRFYAFADLIDAYLELYSDSKANSSV
jgi:hypothetical protein